VAFNRQPWSVGSHNSYLEIESAVFDENVGS